MCFTITAVLSFSENVYENNFMEVVFQSIVTEDSERKGFISLLLLRNSDYNGQHSGKILKR